MPSCGNTATLFHWKNIPLIENLTFYSGVRLTTILPRLLLARASRSPLNILAFLGTTALMDGAPIFPRTLPLLENLAILAFTIHKYLPPLLLTNPTKKFPLIHTINLTSSNSPTTFNTSLQNAHSYNAGC